jgi:hypothetical protein
VSFADEAEKEKREGYLGRGCGVGAMLGQLDPKLREEVTEALNDRPDIPATAIRKALLKRAETYAGRSFRVPSAYTLVRHRRGDCNCESSA